MAGIDYTIPGQFKGIQVESPMNAMAQAMQLRAMQESSQMNALKAQEYQRKVQEDQELTAQHNELAKIHSSGVKIGSPEYFNLVAAKAPRLIEAVQDRALRRSELDEKIEERKFKNFGRKFDLYKSFVPTINSIDGVTQFVSAAYQDPDLAPILNQIRPYEEALNANQDEYNRDPENWKLNAAGVSPEKIMEIARNKAREEREANKPVVVAPGGVLVSPTGEQLFKAPDREKESDLARLERERGEIAKENPDDPRIKNYDAAIAKLVNPPESMSDLARLQNERAAIAKANADDPRLKDYDARISKLINPAEHLSDLARKQSELEELEAQLVKDPNNAKLKQRIKEYKDDIRKDTQWKPSTVVMQAPTLTKDALDMAADRFLTDGTLPPGISKANRDAIMNRAAAVAKDKGINPDRVAQLEVTANKQALGQLSKTETMVGAFEKNFIKNVKIVENLNSKRDSSGVPILQKWINAGKKAVSGDTDLASLNIAIKAVVNEYGKIVSGSMGNTAVAVSEIKRMEDLLNAAQTPQDVQAVLNTMKAETQNRMEGFKEQRAELTQSMRSSTAAPTDKPAAPAVGTVKDGYKFKGGNPADKNNWEKVK